MVLWSLAWAVRADGPAMSDATSAVRSDHAPRILVLGDSLSAAYGIRIEEGWVALLEGRLREHGLPHRVVNASISGETSAGGRARLPDLLARDAYSVVIVELGGNDGLRGLGVEQTRDNLRAIVRTARDAGARVLLAGMRLPPNYGRTYTEAFAAIFPELAEQERVALVPFLLDGIATRPRLMQPDRIHPRADAQGRMLDHVWPELEPLLDTAH